MSIPADLMYTKQHEWVSIDGDTATVGITEYAQQELGDIVYVELPEVGESFEAEESFGSVESVKAVSQIYMPLSGRVIAVNEDLADAPEIVNQDPYGEGWMIKVEIIDPSLVHELMSAEEYENYLKEEAG
ncbi:MAG TPA: glycine cleavage system protein GcvH [Acidobacteriota bacterium]|jgi:glycine cleavage system H protein|nr:glycine cleavage system protein GcvH [Acidobacteriota bacterium]HRR27090.1 glycine cleavage system protein GcvH [Acidobacteriota bacterium]HRR56300.1 glycine cleavage system protein GcvH [Acidobacteriota bacterium]HRV08471.1 glycine cleavage system protein GcvH [Acidobacteriota bacterium]